MSHDTQRIYRQGAALALGLAVVGGMPAARAGDEAARPGKPASRTVSGAVAEVFGKHFVLTLEDGRRILVETPVKTVVLPPGERLEVTGEDEDGEFEATRIRRADGTILAAAGHDTPKAEDAAPAPQPMMARIGAAAAIAAVEQAGYSGVTELEWEDGAWEIEALDRQSRPAKLRVDASSGAVTAQAD